MQTPRGQPHGPLRRNNPIPEVKSDLHAARSGVEKLRARVRIHRTDVASRMILRHCRNRSRDRLLILVIVGCRFHGLIDVVFNSLRGISLLQIRPHHHAQRVEYASAWHSTVASQHCRSWLLRPLLRRSGAQRFDLDLGRPPSQAWSARVRPGVALSSRGS